MRAERAHRRVRRANISPRLIETQITLSGRVASGTPKAAGPERGQAAACAPWTHEIATSTMTALAGQAGNDCEPTAGRERRRVAESCDTHPAAAHWQPRSRAVGQRDRHSSEAQLDPRVTLPARGPPKFEPRTAHGPGRPLQRGTNTGILGARAPAPWRLARLARTSTATHVGDVGPQCPLLLMRTSRSRRGRGRGDATRARGRLRIRSARWPHQAEARATPGLAGLEPETAQIAPEVSRSPAAIARVLALQGCVGNAAVCGLLGPEGDQPGRGRRVRCFARCRGCRARGAPP